MSEVSFKSVLNDLADKYMKANQKSDENPKGAIVSTIYKLEKSISLNQKLEL